MYNDFFIRIFSCVTTYYSYTIICCAILVTIMVPARDNMVFVTIEPNAIRFVKRRRNFIPYDSRWKSVEEHFPDSVTCFAILISFMASPHNHLVARGVIS